jgi:tetratricopeptide (TPR) repeat protein
MFNWPGSTDFLRRSSIVLSVVLSAALIARSTSAVDQPQTITLWSLESDRAAASVRVAQNEQTQRPTIYRLPAAENTSVATGMPTVLVNRFTQSELTPPPKVVERELATLRTTPRGPLREVQIVDDLPSAEAPLPPVLAAKRTPPVQELNRSASSIRENADRATDEAEWNSQEAGSWSLDEEDPYTSSLAMSSPESDVTPLGGDESQSRSTEFYAVRPALPNTPTVAQVSDQVVPSVRRAYSLAQRGALYAARGELIAVLRRIAQSKDAEHTTDRHAQSLADGLRALDEADDFMPPGVQLEADLDVRALARSHRTPVLHGATSGVLPHDAVARYHAYAQQQMAAAVAGEQAGSMALYGLGKIYSRIAAGDDNQLQSLRKGMTMYQAALSAHGGNHLAANELGVLLAQAGHHVQAVAMFQQAVQVSPNATALRNLAIAQRKLGDVHQAMRNEQEAERVARWERSVGAVSRQMGVQQVSPAELARLGPPPPRPALPAQLPVAQQAAPSNMLQATATVPARTASRSWWPWSRAEKEQAPSPVPPSPQRIARPPGTPTHHSYVQPRMDPVKSNTVWR